MKAKDTLLSTMRVYLKNIAMVPDELDGQIASTAFCVLRPNINIIDPNLLNIFVSNQTFINKLTTLQRGNSPPAVLEEDVKAQPISLAPLTEQRRIVSKIEELFSDIDAGEASLRKAQKLIATYRQSVLKAAFTGELVKSPGSNWRQFKVGDLLTDIRYGTAKKGSYDPSKIPVLRIPNVVSGKINLSELKHTDFEASELNKLKLREGDLLLVRSNGSAALVARSAVVGPEAKGYAYAGYLIRLRLQPDKVLPQFLHLFFHSPATRSFIKRQARSTSGVHNINSDEIKNLALQLPSVEVQSEIIDKVEEIFSRIDALETWCRTELARSASLRQSILKATFSGKLVPQDPSDEPASALLERIRAERNVQPNKQNGRAPNAAQVSAKRGRKPRSTLQPPAEQLEQLELL